MDLGLKGKVAIITAAAKGLGKGFADELAQEGANVVITARGKDALEQAAEEMRRHGGKVLAIRTAAAKSIDVQPVVDETMKTFGRIDILVNNAGEAWLGHSMDTTDEEWHYAMDVNLYSAVRFTRAVVPHMRRQGGGRIINIASVSGHTMLNALADYQAAKAAMIAYSKSMSLGSGRR